MYDVNVIVIADTKPRKRATLGILVLSMEGVKPLKSYKDMRYVALDYAADDPAYRKAKVIFDQKNLNGETVQSISIAGIDAPDSTAALAASLEAIREQNDDWYYLLTTRHDDDLVKDLAAWALASYSDDPALDHRKLFIGKTGNPELSNITRRSVIIYGGSRVDEEEADAALIGQIAPYFPHQATWKFKQLQGVSPCDLSRTQTEFMLERFINAHITENKRTYLKEGVAGDGEFADVVIGIDSITFDMRRTIQDILLRYPNIPYMDSGFTLIGAGVVECLQRHAEYGVIATDPNSGTGIYQVHIPLRSEATEEQVAARAMPEVTWEAQLGGAVHSVRISGVLKLTL